MWLLSTIHGHSADAVGTKKLQMCVENVSDTFLLVNYLMCLDTTKSPKIVSHGAVYVPKRVVRLFLAPLALMRTALVGTIYTVLFWRLLQAYDRPTT